MLMLLWIPAFTPNSLNILPFSNNTQTPLFLQLTNFINNYYIKLIVGLLLIIVEVIILIRLNFKYVFIEQRTHLPALIFILTTSAIAQYQMLNDALLANIFILLAIDKAFSTSRNTNCLKSYFEAGIFAGIASLIHVPSIHVLLLLWITLFTIRSSFNWREWCSSIIGFITPIFFYGSILYLQNNLANTIHSYTNVTNNILSEHYPLSTYKYIALALFVVIFIMSVLFTLHIIKHKKINTRNYYNMFIWIIILSTPLFFFVSFYNYLYILAIPLSVILGMFFVNMKKGIFSEILFFLLIASVFTFIWF